MHVFAAGARAQQQFRTARQLEQQLAAKRPVVAVFGIGGAAGGVAKERVVVIALERQAAVDAVHYRAVQCALDPQ
jgi:hypothetical protein